MPKEMHKSLKGSIYESDQVSPGLLFWRAFFNWQKLIQQALEPYELTQAQYAVLAATSFLSSGLSRVRQQDIAWQLGMDKMMVSDVVKSLLKKKFLTRKRHPEDARAFVLGLSSSGSKTVRACVPIVEKVDEEFFKTSGKHRSDLVSGLRLLSQAPGQK